MSKAHYMANSVVIIPTYNEIENIERIVRNVFALQRSFDILVVDDGSPDGTGAMVKQMQEVFPDRLHLIERSGKQGLGTAYIKGFQWSLERTYDFI